MQRLQHERVEVRRRELLALGYRPGVVQIALDWATNSAEAMAQYFSDENHMVDPGTLLPRYLKGLGLGPHRKGLFGVGLCGTVQLLR